MTQALDSQTLMHGALVREPAGSGPGYWVGAPGAYFDETDRAWYLTYRVRRPRGVEPDRGGVARIARSNDGVHFDDIWEVRKDAYGSTSIERSAIRRGRDGRWRYFTSFVDPVDGRWCTAILKADTPDGFDPRRAQHLFTGPMHQLEGVKDPFVVLHENRYYMLLSVAQQTADTGDDAHATHDIYNTGQCLSATALASSKDLDFWHWEGVVFAPPPGQIGKQWDGYCRRINSVVSIPPLHGHRHLAFYDGSSSHLMNYEECAGMAISGDLRSWERISTDEPSFLSASPSKSIRYIDAVQQGGALRLFYEIARKDGSHELRTLETNAGQIPIVREILTPGPPA